MRARLFALLLTLIALVVVSLLTPLAMNYAINAQRQVFIDRLQDTNRFALLLRDGAGSSELTGLRDEIDRYYDVYGIPTVVLDAHRQVLVSSATVDIDDSTVSDRIDTALSGRSTEEMAIWPWQDRPLVVAVPFLAGEGAGVAGVVVTVSPTDGLRTRVGTVWLVLAALSLGAIALFVAVADALATWILRPVKNLDAAAHAITSGDLTSRAPDAAGPPELRRLARSFNEMAATVSGALDQQRAFVAEASHQMRNPLTALLLRVGNLADAVADEHAGDLPDQAKAEYDEAVREGQRLQRVLEELLALARAERHLGAVRRVDVGKVLDERLSAWRVRADLRGQLLVRSGVASAEAVVDPESLGRVLDELLDNASRYAGDDGVIVAAVRAGTGSPGFVRLTISDDGDGLPMTELDKVAGRFWRSPSHANVPGTGLGLSIVTSLLQTFGARLEVTTGPQGGLAVTCVLPAPAAAPASPPEEPQAAKDAEPQGLIER
ncbi:sensor histidine kinase [Cryptosporangium phraense]|uniref:histidine kinase n=1 Tax=Cryptosporangium phraense TaxID=2593070 RepID=A0A545AU26_9ACTN|nr:HAMP domain-containing sensor histidine kinase [Cryptosporangium phraense]TQS44847.1 HAMP domain-containing histidine kinase [Cryptosporangium phraense]